jgi:hypothetical protein
MKKEKTKKTTPKTRTINLSFTYPVTGDGEVIFKFIFDNIEGLYEGDEWRTRLPEALRGGFHSIELWHKIYYHMAAKDPYVRKQIEMENLVKEIKRNKKK